MRYIGKQTKTPTKKKILPLALAAIVSGDPLWAQTTSTLDTVVVTASRVEQSTLEAPASVSVVGAQKLEDAGTARVTDALTAKVPGFYWRGPTGTADRVNTGANVSMRGQGNNRVKIMLDGVGLADGHSGQYRSLLGVEMDDIERIEVVPGISSALYGSDAIGGVVNVITKVPGRQEIKFKYTRGFDDAKRDVYSVSYRNRLENGLGVSLSAGYEEREGSARQNEVWSTTPSYATRDPKEVSTNASGQTTYLIGDRGAIPSRVSRLNARFFYDLDAKSHFYAGFGYYEVKLGFTDYHQYVSGTVAPSSLWNSSNPTYNEEFRYQAGYDGKIGRDFDLKVSISHARQDYYYVASSTGATAKGGNGYQTGLPNNTLQGSLQLGFALGKRQYLIAGVSSILNETRRKSHNVDNWRHPEGHHTGLRDKTNADNRTDAFFIQDRIFVTDALTLYAGGRYDRWTTDGTVWNATGTLRSDAAKASFSPRLAAVYRWDDATSFRASVGKGFRAPTNNDLYALSRSTDSSGTSNARLLVPDPHVKPEIATSIDLGVERNLPGNGYVKAAVFWTKVKDLLTRKVSAPDGTYDYLGYTSLTEYSKMSNAGEARMKGIELSGEMPLNSWLRASASYSWTDAKITRDDSGITSLKGKTDTNVPKNMASIGLDAKWQGWHANLMSTYIGHMFTQADNSDRKKNVYGTTGSYWLSNLRVGYRIDKNFEATLAINNLFDKKYYEFYLMPGRNLALELRGSF